MLTLAFLLGVGLCISGLANSASLPDAEVVWVSRGDDQLGRPVNQILYSSLRNDEWSLGNVIYTSEYSLTTPSIFTMHHGQKVVVWSELLPHKTVLMYQLSGEARSGAASVAEVSDVAVSINGANNDTANGEEANNYAPSWSEATLLSDVGIENLGPALMESGDGQLWAFWSAHQNDNDDIYQSHFNGASWSAAARVHNKNSVPDYAPSAFLNEDNQLIVEWKSFSATLNRYQTAQKTVAEGSRDDRKLVSTTVKQDKTLPEPSLSDIVQPSFLPANALHIVHFPSNTFVKNFRLNDR